MYGDVPQFIFLPFNEGGLWLFLFHIAFASFCEKIGTHRCMELQTSLLFRWFYYLFCARQCDVVAFVI